MIDQLISPPLRIFAQRRVKKITGIENIPVKGPILLVANHIDYLDGWLLSLLIVPRIRKKIYFISQTKNYFWASGVTIPLEKNGKGEALKTALKHLDEGKIIVLFPEGRRNSQKELLKGKTGAARLALWSRCPVVPIGIIGPSAPSFRKAFLGLFIRPNKVIINIGPTVDLNSYYDKEIDYSLLTNCTREIMRVIGKLARKPYPY